MAAVGRTRLVGSIFKAFQELNPGKVRAEADKSVCLAVVGVHEAVQDIAQALIGTNPTAYDAASSSLLLIPTPMPDDALDMLRKCDIVLTCTEMKNRLPGVDFERQFVFSSKSDMPSVIQQILHKPFLEYTHLPLARSLPGFRSAIAANIIHTISMENAVFVVSTSLGNVIPNPLQPLAAIAASAGDLVVLTANQLRMLFKLAAAHNLPLGIKPLLPEIGTIIGAAFGWRSIARELVGQIPMGGGIIPKAGIAYAGTKAIGDGISYYYTTGRHMSRDEIKLRFDAALSQGKDSLDAIIGKLKESFSDFSNLNRR